MTTASSDRANGYFDLELKVDKCKFYPLRPLAVVAGYVIKVPVISNEQFNGRTDLKYVEDQLQIGTRCLVYVQPSSGQVPSLIKRWANECRETKKCTNWIKVAENLVTCRIDIDANSTNSVLEECRNFPGAWMLRSSQGLSRISDPPTVQVTITMDQSKFYPTKLAILDGSILHVDRNSTSDLTSEEEKDSIDFLENGERCWLHVRSNVVSLLKTLHGVRKLENEHSTGWVQLDRSIPVSCRVVLNDDLRQRKMNGKEALILECYEVLEISKGSGFNGSRTSLGSNETASSTNPPKLPIRADRKERHRIFAEWLVKTYGADFLSTGSGVLDVAGGNGVLGNELWKLGVKSTLLDPEPRCNAETTPFQVISKPLVGNGSDLTGEDDEDGIETEYSTHPIKTDERRRIRHLVRNCSIIAGMHPDEATEAIIDTSLRLGKPFAMLPCCIFRNLNVERQEIRKQREQGSGGTDPFRSYSTFCHFLLNDKSPAGIRFQTENLPFEGRNKVVYMRRDYFQCKEIICN